MSDLAAETQEYQRLLERRRVVNALLDEDPFDDDLQDVYDDLSEQLTTARKALDLAWLDQKIGETS